MTNPAKNILKAVEDYHKKHNDYPSQSQVARQLNKHRTYVFKYVGELVELGLVALRKGTVIEPVQKSVTKIILKNKK